MEYNFLLLKDNKLSIQKNKTFLQLNQENIDNLKEDYSLIKDNEVVINFEKVSSALKELESNKIIAHLSRENFRKISFPIFVQSEYLKTYLKDSGLQFELSLFLENSNFLKIELDS